MWGSDTTPDITYIAETTENRQDIYYAIYRRNIFGLPGLIGSRSFLGGEEQLDIYGPSGLDEWLKTTLRVTNTHLNYELIVHEIGEGIVFEDTDYRVTAKRLQHIIPCLGYPI